MTPEEQTLLLQSIKLAEENNKILRSMRRSARVSSFLGVIYWLIILASIFGVYYTLQPYIDSFLKGYNSMLENIDGMKDIISNIPFIPTGLGGKQ